MGKKKKTAEQKQRIKDLAFVRDKGKSCLKIRNKHGKIMTSKRILGHTYRLKMPKGHKKNGEKRKEPTEKQKQARRNFTIMSKNGTLKSLRVSGGKNDKRRISNVVKTMNEKHGGNNFFDEPQRNEMPPSLSNPFMEVESKKHKAPLFSTLKQYKTQHALNSLNDAQLGTVLKKLGETKIKFQKPGKLKAPQGLKKKRASKNY